MFLFRSPMGKRWKSTADLAEAMRERAARGRNVTLSPETALLVAQLIAPASPPPMKDPHARFRVDLYAEGSTIYQLDHRGEIFQIVAWARNALVARTAFDYLCEKYPKESFSQRRRSWVEADRIIKRET